jgi:hypothetical protein
MWLHERLSAPQMVQVMQDKPGSWFGCQKKVGADCTDQTIRAVAGRNRQALSVNIIAMLKVCFRHK